MAVGRASGAQEVCYTLGLASTMRLKIIGNEIIKNVVKSQSCMVSKLPIIFKRTRSSSSSSSRQAHLLTVANVLAVLQDPVW